MHLIDFFSKWINNSTNSISSTITKSVDKVESVDVDPYEYFNIYILELNNKKYYVGKTKNLNQTYYSHLSGTECEWTQKYKPLKILEKYNCSSVYDENDFLFETMKRFGIDNVRGCNYSQINLSRIQKIFLEKRISSLKCFKCKSKKSF